MPTLNLQGGLLDGSGAITGNISNAAKVSPGFSPGQITVTGNYTQMSNGLLNIEIAGNVPAMYDQLMASGKATLDGTLNVSLINSFTPNPGDVVQRCGGRQPLGFIRQRQYRQLVADAGLFGRRLSIG